MVETDAVERVLEGEASLDFVSLDSGSEHILNGERLLAVGNVGAADPVGDREDGANVVGRVTPLGGEPGVVEVEPSDQSTVVEGGTDGVELVVGTDDTGTVGHHGTGDDGPQTLAAAGKRRASMAHPNESSRRDGQCRKRPWSRSCSCAHSRQCPGGPCQRAGGRCPRPFRYRRGHPWCEPRWRKRRCERGWRKPSCWRAVRRSGRRQRKLGEAPRWRSIEQRWIEAMQPEWIEKRDEASFTTKEETRGSSQYIWPLKNGLRPSRTRVGSVFSGSTFCVERSSMSVLDIAFLRIDDRFLHHSHERILTIRLSVRSLDEEGQVLRDRGEEKRWDG